MYTPPNQYQPYMPPRPKQKLVWPWILGGVGVLVLALVVVMISLVAHGISQDRAAKAAQRFTAGTYAVGAGAVPAGEYRAICGPAHEWGYYVVRNSTDIHSVADTKMIFRETLFNARAGQYIELSGEDCSFSWINE